ncbi:MAG: A/G-specific adenine glycosylase [Chloroflexota bacterium]|nr:A/G-specific adenine glycosylase [Chloroflexota bacterium]
MYTDGPTRRTTRRRLLRWYGRAGRDLPWRQTRDPYAILVSEVMLQQTQVSRVIPAYTSFLKRFPTLSALARASLGDVLRAWAGLGYHRRAQDLHRTARFATAGLPRDLAALDALPGVGAYTTGAVACFAHGARVAFADTNIRRVLGRIVLGRVASEREAVAIDRELMPRDAATWHHALMDLGATVCIARAPRCADCPLRVGCVSRERAGPTPRQVLCVIAKPQMPFASSDRRVRGRIIALLRGGDRTTAALRRELADARVQRLAGSLMREGLIERHGAKVGLPA